MSSDSLQSGQNSAKTFEFTKRKRWADLLVSELADAVNLVLSSSCNVLYCAPAIIEIAGLKDADLLDHDFSELIATTEDQLMFRASFDDSIQQNTDLHSFVRIKCSENFTSSSSSTSNDVLFEIKGHPRSVEAEGTILFVTAKPYPSRNTEMLNTFLELKTENDRLQYRRSELAKQLPPRASALPLTVIPSQIYATSPIDGIPLAAAETGVEASCSYNSFSNSNAVGFDALLEPSLNSAIFEGGGYSPTLQSPQEGDNEDSLKRKKPKKTQPVEQHVCVTCGRTDSPEWRKGPLGPKTLCNACGLRWAKQTRTEKAEEAVPVC